MKKQKQKNKQARMAQKVSAQAQSRDMFLKALKTGFPNEALNSKGTLGGQFDTELIPAAVAQKYKQQRPKFSFSPDGVVVEHIEFVDDVLGSVGFAGTAYKVNPGYNLLFPWLAILARGFQSFEFLDLELMYIPTVGTDKKGSVMLGVDYDAEASFPLNKQAFLQYLGTTTGVPYYHQIMRVSKQALDTLGKRKYILHGFPINDLKTYVPAQLIVATSGMADTSAVGEFFVRYRVLLLAPEINTSFGTGFILGGSGTGSVGSTPANPLGTAPTLDSGTLGLSYRYIDGTNTSEIQSQGWGTILFAIVFNGTALSDCTVVAATGIVAVQKHLLINGAGVVGLAVFSITIPQGHTSAGGRFRPFVVGSTCTSVTWYVGQAPPGSLTAIKVNEAERTLKPLLERYGERELQGMIKSLCL